MCSPISFHCPTPHCGRKHNYKLNPCRAVRASTAGLPLGTPIHPFMCQNARLATYRVACDSCKERWKAGRREERREEERERRRSRVNSVPVVGVGVDNVTGGGGQRRATVAPVAVMGPPASPQVVRPNAEKPASAALAAAATPLVPPANMTAGVGSVDPRLTILSYPAKESSSNVVATEEEVSPRSTFVAAAKVDGGRFYT